MHIKKLLFIAFLFLINTSAVADEGIERFKKLFSEQLPGVELTRVSPSPVDGLYEVVSGPEVVYMTKDAQFMLDGDLVNLKTQQNFTEETKAVTRLAKLNTLGEDNMIIYTPKVTKHTVTIVTDVNCPYCRRLHEEMSKYMQLGVRVRYIFMPLKGKDDFNTTVSIWCADDRNKALDIVKSNGEIESKTCANPIKEQLQLARDIGVRGTPAIILENGRMLPGYVPIGQLIFEIRK